jgi:hypothetical protein
MTTRLAGFIRSDATADNTSVPQTRPRRLKGSYHAADIACACLTLRRQGMISR